MDFAKLPIVTALGLSAFSVAPHLLLPPATSLAFAAVLLGVIAGVYFGFAGRGGPLASS